MMKFSVLLAYLSPPPTLAVEYFSKEAYFVAYKTQNFGQFWLFYHKFTHFLCTLTGPNNAAAILNLKKKVCVV